jgi:hypothetical protein
VNRKERILAGDDCGLPAHKADYYRRIWTSEFPPDFGLPVQVPMPPPLDLTPKHPRAVVTVAAGDVGKALLEISGPLMERYAARVGADYLVLDWPGHPDWPMSSKYATARAFDHYERIAYIDADVLLRETSLDLFAVCEPDEVGVVDELAHHRRAPKFGVESHYRKLQVLAGYRDAQPEFYVNAGVQVLPRSARHLIEPPAAPVPAHHLTEQHLFNARLAAAAEAGAVKLKLLPAECNWQHWHDHGFRKSAKKSVLHFSGMGKPAERLQLMRLWAGAKPGAKPSQPSHGPGTELRALLASIGFTEIPACKCAKKAKQMDKWGASGCKKRRPKIVRWLRAAAALTGFWSKVAAMPKAMAIIPASAWLDPAGWLVDESIRRAGQ